MARILFTWEIGEGTGHVLPALPLLRQFQAKGHEVVAALRDVRACSAALRAEGIRVIQAPIVPMPAMRMGDPMPDTLAHVLQHHGFRCAAELRALALAWVELIRLVRPQQVVASYAPVSLLTAKAMGLATTLLALPFEVPPKQHPLPSLRTGKAPDPKTDSPPADTAVLSAIAATLSPGGFERVVSTATLNPVNPLNPVNAQATAKPILQIDQLHQLFDADHTYLMTIRQLDLWPREAHVRYIGDWLWGKPQKTVENPPVATDTKPIFVYLPADLPQLSSVRQQLIAIAIAIGKPTLAVIRGASQTELSQWQAPHIQAQSTHVDMAHALAHAGVLITHAGHSTVCQALLAGVPMVLIPRSLETRHTAIAAVHAGAAVIADMPEGGDSVINDLAGSIEQAMALTHPRARRQASLDAAKAGEASGSNSKGTDRQTTNGADR